MPSPNVSVIIPAYTCEKTIAETLKAVLAQEASVEIEVIVVDDGSVDGTGEIIKSFATIRYFRQDNAGPAAARNLGAQNAKGKFLFFTDADCTPHPDWVKKMLPHFAQPEVAAVAGSYGIANPDSNLARWVHAEIMYRHHRLMPAYPKVFGSYNVAIRKELFHQVGGFNREYRHASGEDNDLSYKILAAGYKIYFEREALVDHYHPTRLGKYLLEQYRHGFWRVKMYLVHPTMSRGDHYTFWKDILEIPMVILACLLFFFSVMGIASARLFLIWVCLFLMGLEFYFSQVIIGSPGEGMLFAFVMFLRAFARSSGFLAGLGQFVLGRLKGRAV